MEILREISGHLSQQEWHHLFYINDLPRSILYNILINLPNKSTALQQLKILQFNHVINYTMLYNFMFKDYVNILSLDSF